MRLAQRVGYKSSLLVSTNEKTCYMILGILKLRVNMFMWTGKKCTILIFYTWLEWITFLICSMAFALPPLLEVGSVASKPANSPWSSKRRVFAKILSLGMCNWVATGCTHRYLNFYDLTTLDSSKSSISETFNINPRRHQPFARKQTRERPSTAIICRKPPDTR